MTVPVACPPPAADAVPRKRRRRAPASGAQDDCFACTKRSIKCDRRRPYCSQCLEIGNECSGYKTQLTWGVGVASRGKLRGLSLPVAKSAPAARSPPTKSRVRGTSTLHRPSFSIKNEDGKEDGNEDEDMEIKVEDYSPLPGRSFTTYDFINMVPNSPTSATHNTMAGTEWTVSMSQECLRPSHTSSEQSNHQQLLRQSLQRLHTPSFRYADEMNLSSSAGSVSGYSDVEYGSPMAQSFNADDVPYLTNPMSLYNGYSPHDSPVESNSNPTFGMQSSNTRGPTSCPDQFYAQSDVSSSIGSHQTIFEMGDSGRLAASPAACNMSDISYDEELIGIMSTSHGSDHFLSTAQLNKGHWITVADDEYPTHASTESNMRVLPVPEFLNIGLLPEISPRLSFYLNYYEKIICPITVAIDSPTNPYRHHILRLATESQSLQHAICALASCNLRMRRKQSLGQQHWRQPLELDKLDHVNARPRPASTQHSSIPDFSSENGAVGPLDDASIREEYQHRSRAVQLLNQQLSDPAHAKHDSVLATLLMLCHYRMCESGIAQFKTQFAGVKKLMGMRASGLETGSWGWMESIFTWFDAITASVNDREAQLRGGYLEMIASPSSPECALENLSGCDGALFKIIATLGRLNLLSQHRPVLDQLPEPSKSQPSQARPRLAGQALVDFYKFHPHNFDGNGFASTLSDEDILLTPSSSSFPSYPFASNATPQPAEAATPQSRFWLCWKETRLALQNWEFEPARLIASLGGLSLSSPQLRDFGYISEAFRYAALLYTERLACPTLPSSHLNFQNLVAQVLFYITSLSPSQVDTSNFGDTPAPGTPSGNEVMGKFLLWPLFVAGSECVSDLHQSIVRTRCREIAGRSGYLNNLAGLEVLEKIWASHGEERTASTSSPFGWSRFMDSLDGEYIMV